MSPYFSPEGETATIMLRSALWREIGRTMRSDFDDVRLVEVEPAKAIHPMFHLH